MILNMQNLEYIPRLRQYKSGRVENFHHEIGFVLQFKWKELFPLLHALYLFHQNSLESRFNSKELV